MEMEPYISVIVPIYNSSKELRRCIESIVNQSYFFLEIILIDDGSTDDSLSICESYARADSRIRLIHQENHGLAYTRRIGISQASGDYLSFVDSDDSIDLEMYADIVKLMGDSFPDVIAFGLKEVYADHVSIKKNKYDQRFYHRNEILTEVIPTMLSYGRFFDFGILPNMVNKLIRRKFISQIYLCVTDLVTVGEDADYSFQILVQAESLLILDLFPYNYFKRDDSMMFSSIDEKAITSLENDLKSCFEKVGLLYALKNQLQKYISFVTALKTPDCIEAIDVFFKSSGKKCALYGAGGFGYAMYDTYKESISLWVDKKSTLYSQKGMPVASIEQLFGEDREYDFVFIAILNVDLCEKIKSSLISNGLQKRIIYFDGTYVK